jgi:hypothetical protein
LLIRNSFLKVLFPLIVVGISSLLLLSQAIQRKVKLKRSSKQKICANRVNGGAYNSLPTEDGVEDSVTEEEEEDDDEGLSIGGGRFALAKTTTKGSVAEIDAPAGYVECPFWLGTISEALEDMPSE